MAIAVQTKVKIGFSLALVACLAIGGAIAFTYLKLSQAHERMVWVFVAVASPLIWLVGLIAESEKDRQSKGTANGSAASVGEHPLACFKDARHWAILLAVSAGLVYSFNAYRRGQHRVQLATVALSAPKPKPPASFPPLKVQAIILDGTKSSALINGQVVRAGEGIGNVLIVAIDSDHVTVGLEGETKELRLPR
jgi:hypothetical protein